MRVGRRVYREENRYVAAVSCYYQINYALTDVPQVLDSRVGTRGNRHGL